MNIIARYLGIGIEGYSMLEFISILKGENPVKVQINTGGMLILNNNMIINCAKDYYIKSDGSIIKPQKKISNECYFIQKELGVTGIQNYDCQRCHLRCTELHKDGKLGRR